MNTWYRDVLRHVNLLWYLKKNITFCDMKSLNIYEAFVRAYYKSGNIWFVDVHCTFSANSYCKWIGDKTKFKVETVGVVNKEMSLSETRKCICLWGARSLRSLAHISKLIIFQVLSSVSIFFCHTPTNPANRVNTCLNRLTTIRQNTPWRSAGGGGGAAEGRSPGSHIRKIHLLLKSVWSLP